MQFIDSMTGRLAWPITAVLLGVIFRRSLGRLLSRVQRVSWGEAQADLADATHDVQESLDGLTQTGPDDEQPDPAYRQQLEQVVHDAARWGFRLHGTGVTEFPNLRILWAGDNRPRLIYTGSPDSEYEVYVIGGPSLADPGNNKLREYIDRFVEEEDANTKAKRSFD
ncbi:hypothetical protein [Actinomadura harenae]|uniref:hypothetical protein n=1 Tax=Actinomadura harenae TaxID=2483351 RepID=UPI0011C445AE|nr:hypothetical protein [Actinomadura harenae]